MAKIEERRSKELASGCFHFERFFLSSKNVYILLIFLLSKKYKSTCIFRDIITRSLVSGSLGKIRR